jgi:uncharacterized membrane protein
VAYVFNNYTRKAILCDGREIPLARKAGEVFYNEAVTHKIVNTGNAPIHNVIVELKEPDAPLGSHFSTCSIFTVTSSMPSGNDMFRRMSEGGVIANRRTT